MCKDYCDHQKHEVTFTGNFGDTEHFNFKFCICFICFIVFHLLFFILSFSRICFNVCFIHVLLVILIFYLFPDRIDDFHFNQYNWPLSQKAESKSKITKSMKCVQKIKSISGKFSKQNTDDLTRDFKKQSHSIKSHVQIVDDTRLFGILCVLICHDCCRDLFCFCSNKELVAMLFLSIIIMMMIFLR